MDRAWTPSCLVSRRTSTGFKRQGVKVEQHNLAQQPAAFASNPLVTGALREHGNDCLPLVLVNGQVASRGSYPERSELARLVGLESPASEGIPAEKGRSLLFVSWGGRDRWLRDPFV